MFLKEEKICYKMVYNTLCLGSANLQRNRVGKLEFKQTKKPTFLKGAWHLKD